MTLALEKEIHTFRAKHFCLDGMDLDSITLYMSMNSQVCPSYGQMLADSHMLCYASRKGLRETMVR